MARRTAFRTAVLIALAAVVALDGAVAQSTPDCTDAQACFPWSPSGPSCRRNSRFNLRFMLDIADENGWKETDGKMNHQAVYGFCPRVDELQSFTLNTAPFLASAYKAANADGVVSYRLTRTLSLAYLSVYGFGNTNNTIYPNKGTSTGAVVLAQNGSTVCSSFRSAALVTTLVLNVGLNRGLFNYDGASNGGMQLIVNPNYDPSRCGLNSSSSSSSSNGAAPALSKLSMVNPAAALSSSSSSSGEINYCDEQIEVYVGPNIVQPLKTGFEPTCGVDSNGDDFCMFDDGAEVLCIGNPGQKNCARCYTDAQLIANQASLQVWTSYYGSDSRGDTLRSGGTNPINFRRFAKPSMFTDIGARLKSLWSGNVSESGLPVWPF